MISSKPVVLPRTTVTRSAVTHLREEIVAGNLHAGEALPEEKVGELLGVSRVPVRDALRLLEREGLIAFDRRGTARVCEFGLDAIRELEVVRLALEPVAARLACEQKASPYFAEIEENLLALRQADSLSDVTRLDIEFHRLIFFASGNRRLLAAWEGLASQLLLVMTRFHRAMQSRTGRVRDLTHESHSKLFAGLQGDDPILAEELARQHTLTWRTEMNKSKMFESREEGTP